MRPLDSTLWNWGSRDHTCQGKTPLCHASETPAHQPILRLVAPTIRHIRHCTGDYFDPDSPHSTHQCFGGDITRVMVHFSGHMIRGFPMRVLGIPRRKSGSICPGLGFIRRQCLWSCGGTYPHAHPLHACIHACIHESMHTHI